MAKDTPWDKNLLVTSDGEGLIGHAGAMTGWRYSIIVTNIPGTGIKGVPGSHHPQFIDVLHREFLGAYWNASD